MPNIEEFTAGNIDIRPQEIGVESTAAAGRRLGVYGSQIAESYTQAGRALGQVADTAEKYLEHREVNTGAAHGADLIAAKNQSWNNFITGKDIPADDPDRQDKINQRINNPQAAKQWREQSLEPDLQQFQQGFWTPGGRQWAAEFANRYRLHMAEHTAAEQSSMAGAVVQANNEKATNSFATATFNDPSGLKTNLGLLNHTIDGTVQSSPTMSPVDATKVTTELKQRAGEKLVAAAIQGAILKGGNWQAIANDPAYAPYVKPAENMQFERYQKQYERAQEYDARMIERMDREQKKDASDAAADGYRIEITKKDRRLAQDPVAQRVVADPALLPAAKDRLLNEIRRDNLPETDAKVSAETEVGLLRELRTATSDKQYKELEDKIWAARLKNPGEPGSMTKNDTNDALRELENRKTPQGLALAQDREKFFQDYAATIDGGMFAGQHSALGNQQLYAARRAAMREEQELQKTPSGNPHDLYDPDSPRFFGKKISTYAKTLSETVEYATQNLIGAGRLGIDPQTIRTQNGVHYAPIGGQYVPVQQDAKGDWILLNAAK